MGFCYPHILGLCASFDSHGQMAALAGFISKVGLATGPLVGSLLILDYGFEMILNIATVALIGATLLITYSSANQKEAT